MSDNPLAPPAAPARDLAAVLVAYVAALVAALIAGLIVSGRHPLVIVLVADLVGTLVVFAFSVWRNNSSVYDPYWSVAPIVIAVYHALGSGGDEASKVRQLVVGMLVTLWGVRLTYNWLRRWRGLQDEDWRYADLRKKTGWGYWPLSLLGLHLMPTLVVYAGSIALYPALRAGARGLGLLDLLALLVTAGAIWIESQADVELHAHLTTRSDEKATLTTGLWARCRHPNYLGELLFWWGIGLFGVAACPWADAWWVAIGPVAMTLLFLVVSIPLINKRMLARRPDYAERMKQVPALLPLGKPAAASSAPEAGSS